jgi:UDP-N-acetylmuramoyl-tripeptide--D-alanyl-D-alanine ligase
MTLHLQDLLAATGGEALQTKASEFAGASIDSRSIQKGELFFALKAARDGHEFLPDAIKRGAGGVVIERGRRAPAGVTAVAVDDTRKALGAYGQFIRRKVNPKIVGVTGSAGKTTTKDLCAAALGAGTLKTEGNLNNDLGVPLTLLRLGAEKFAVVEMGMSARGEIAYLAELAEPDVGVVTLIAPAHLEKLGSIEEIAKAKGELFHGLKPDGVAILPDDDARLAAEAKDCKRRVTFGETERADARVVTATPQGDVTLSLGGERIEFKLPLVGRHNARNAAAAAAVAWVLGRPAGEIARGLAQTKPTKNRSEVTQVGGRNVIADLYNANPTSTKAAIDAVVGLKGSARAFAILGDMLELGPESPQLHRDVGAHVVARGVDGLIGVGKLGREFVRGALDAGMAREFVFMSDEKYAAAVRAVEWTQPGDWIVIKGSRGMKMEDVLAALREELE